MSFRTITTACLLLLFFEESSGQALYTTPNAILYVGNNAKLCVNNGDVTTHDPILGAGNGKLILKGTATQHINSSGFSVYGFEIDNPANVSMDADLVVPGDLTLTNGALQIQDKTLNIGGVVSTTNGSLTGSAQSSISITGSGGSAGTLYFSSGSGLLRNLSLNRSGGGDASVGNPLRIMDALTVTNGTLYTGNQLTLNSDATSTARIAPVNGSIDGSVTVERYIPASGNRAWRLLSAPLQPATAPTIYIAWQEAGNNGNYGTHITQQGGAGTNGFDASNVALSSSVRHWDGSALQTPVNTNNTKVTDNGAAYFLFVRGDRTVNLNDLTANSNTTLRMKGPVNQGNITVGMPGSNYSLIPNPYASPVDYEAVWNGNGNNLNSYFIWDATLNSVGAYRTIERLVTGEYEATPSTGSAISDNTARYIQSGQAFFIPVNTTVNFTEGMKVAAIPAFNVYKTTTSQEQLLINLEVVSATGITLADGIRIKFDPAYNNGFDNDDVLKFSNFNENLSINKSVVQLAVERRQLPVSTDTVFLKLWNTGIRNYRFSFLPNNLAIGMTGLIIDDFLNTATPIDLNNGGTYAFSITSAAGSSDPSRFKIVFASGNPLGLLNVRLNGTRKQHIAELDWKVSNEWNVDRYELERSGNAQDFKSVYQVPATANNGSEVQYAYQDGDIDAASYYRVKLVDKRGLYTYSNTIRLSATFNNDEHIQAYPNPVSGKNFNLIMNGVPQGQYRLSVYLASGQLVWTQQVLHNGSNNSVYAIRLNTELASGNYQIQVTGNDEIQYHMKLIVR